MRERAQVETNDVVNVVARARRNDDLKKKKQKTPRDSTRVRDFGREVEQRGK